MASFFCRRCGHDKASQCSRSPYNRRGQSYSMAHSAIQSPHFAELPEILTPKHLMEYLPLGRDAIYDALKSQMIRNVRIGQKFIITKGALREFLGGDVE
jgi:hypothetical protein